MKGVSFKAWRTASQIWHLIYLGTEKGETFDHGSGFEDLMITDETGVVVNPFGYCDEFMQKNSGDEKYLSSWDRCRTCPLFPTYCGYNSIDGSAEYAVIWQYVDAMRMNDQATAAELAEKIFRKILFQCPHPLLARIRGINIKQICKEIEK